MSINYNQNTNNIKQIITEDTLDKIFVKDLKPLISEERLIELKQEAKCVRNKITKNGTCHIETNYLINRAIEVPNTNRNNKHKDITDAEKAVLSANIVFDDKRFSKYLLTFLAEKNYSQQFVENYIKALDYLKTAKERGMYDTINKEIINKLNIVTRQLTIFYTKYTGINNASIIINKINEILSFTPELIYQENNTARHTR